MGGSGWRLGSSAVSPTWDTGWERGTEPAPAVIAGLVLHDENIARLLNVTERAQLLALSTVALERYQEKTNPPNKLGKTIAASLKETR